MQSRRKTRTLGAVVVCALVAVALLAVAGNVLAGPKSHTSKPFMGPKANKGFVTHSTESGKSILTLSEDFVVPDTPDPHWRVMDSKGTVYDLAKLKVKNDGYNKTVVVPPYVKDVAKVIIWCAFAETNLGEAAFDQPVK
jgi:hypothetical protein